MRRVAILIALILADIWLISGAARDGQPVIPGVASTVSAQVGCCPEGTGDIPHLACVNYQCVLVYDSCGFDDCSACAGCDPIQEQSCLNIGWIWDPVTCTCSPPGCDPVQRQECINGGGDWDENTCTCAYTRICIPDDPQLVDFDSVSSSYCADCLMAEVCTTETYYFAQYCQDGRLYDSWSESYYYCEEEFNWDCIEWCTL
jgi:hypothetical protein